MTAPALRVTAGLFSLLAALALARTIPGAETNALVVPTGYAIEKVAGDPAIRFPMFAAFDERGRLFVAESSGLDLYAELQKLSRTCRISVLEDRDGDGQFESSRVFAEHLVFPMGLAWREGKLYVADPPYVVALEDADGDGMADKRKVVLGNFGHTDNGSLHGLLFGPDGWLYMTMGQPDGYEFKQPDGTVITGKSGALIRCRPDGSGVQVLSRGFENLVEVDFQPTGEIIGTDNWFYLPASGVRDALVHLLEGGLYPRYLRDVGSPMLVSGEPLPCIAVYPAVALSGFTRYRGSAFPDLQGDFFSAQHNTRKVIAHHFQRAASSFQSSDTEFVTTEDPDFHPSDVLEDADGSLLVVDTGSWYIHHCPTGRIRHVPAPGGVYRVHYLGASPPGDPRGLKLDWRPETQPTELVNRLLDARPAVRDRAAEQIVRTGSSAVGTLSSLLKGALSAQAMEATVWSLARIPEGRPALLAFLEKSNDANALALSARALGRVEYQPARSRLLQLLEHPAPQVQLAAAEALAHCGDPQVVPAVFNALATTQDRMIEHSLMNVLYRWAGRDSLLRALNRESPNAQKAALILLDQYPHNALPPEAAVDRLFSSDPGLRTAARAALSKHADWVERALPALRKVLGSISPDQSDLAMVAELLGAFHASPPLIDLVADTLRSPEGTSPEALVGILESIGRLPTTQVPASWAQGLAHLLASPSPLVQQHAVRTARALQLPSLDKPLQDLVRDNSKPTDLRMDALAAVARRHPDLHDSEYGLLWERMAPTNAANIRLGAAEILSQAQLPARRLARFVRLAKADPIVAPTLVFSAAQHSPEAPSAGQDLLEYLQQAANTGWSIPAEILDWVEKIMGSSSKAAVAQLRTLSAEREERQRAQLQALQPLLHGGDPNRGQELFLTKATCATCHRVGQHGGVVGPDLTKIGAIRSGQDLLESLAAPSATFAQGYEPYIVTLKDGESISGVRVRQPDESFVLREAGGNETRLSPEQIERVMRSQTSIMPEGLLTVLSPNETRDLLAYLQNLK